ncbi:MAG TPA: SDR family NAD(P)-dependent oxidoreductase [Anaerolineae bacterium]|jgi:NAD(P)-dependent dehydrogenase (short-subunit alcohol dehydrogenase family)|nr:SDR family NAD(P)-dependent oxidoreductase [Anaerolineae bacterium]
MSDLQGRVVVVTGAGRGIGKTIAHVLAQKGMQVGINDVNVAMIESVVNEFRAEGLSAIGLQGDVSSKADAAAMIEKAEAELGPLWLLVNNAGVLNAGPTAELSEAAWDTAMAVDAKGVFLCSQAAIQKMIPRGQGRIVNVASIAGLIVRTGQIAYCSAKAAVIHFSRCLAVEMAPHGITVNCLCPGMTRTQMLSQSAAERGLDLDAMVELIPAGRMAEEKDHAHLIAYFASDESRHVTGQVVTVDGAQSLYHPLMPRVVTRPPT